MDVALIQASIQFLLYVAYLAIHRIYTVLQSVVWLVTGVHSARRNASQPQNYKKSAQVLNILFRYKVDIILQPTALHNFVLTHSHFASPDDLLSRPNVTLYNMTDTEVVLVEVDDSVDVTDMNVHSFMGPCQYLNAKSVILIPHEAFFRAGESFPLPEKVDFVTYSARCGSTLMVQFFQDTGECLALSEPDVLSKVAVMYEKKTKPEADIQRYLKTCLRLLLKPRVPGLRAQHMDDEKHYVIKLRSSSLAIAPLLAETIPESRFIFMYRDLLPSTKSLAKISNVMPLYKLTLFLGQYSERLSKVVFDIMQLPMEDDFFKKSQSHLVKSAKALIFTCAAYLEFRNAGMKIAGVKYEHWISHPDHNTKLILEFLDLPEKWSTVAREVSMNQDSQRNSPLSQKNVKKYKLLDLDEETESIINAVCDECGMDHIREPTMLDGTITEDKD